MGSRVAKLAAGGKAFPPEGRKCVEESNQEPNSRDAGVQNQKDGSVKSDTEIECFSTSTRNGSKKDWACAKYSCGTISECPSMRYLRWLMFRRRIARMR